MPAAWVSAGVGILGAATASDAASTAADQNQQAINDSRTAAQAQLAFDRQRYDDSQPFIQATQAQSLQTNAQQQQIAAQAAQRSQTAWNQNQQANTGVAGQIGLNALGGQYLNPQQQQELMGLQQSLARQNSAAPPAAPQLALPAPSNTGGATGLNTTDMARLQQLQGLQGNAVTTEAREGTASRWVGGAGDGGMVMGTDAVPASTTFTPALQAEMAALQQRRAGNQSTPTRVDGVPQGVSNGSPKVQGMSDLQTAQTIKGGSAPATTEAMNPDQIQARINQLQQMANQGAVQRETDRAGLITGTAGRFAGQTAALGESNAQSITNDAGGQAQTLLNRGDTRRGEQQQFYDAQGNAIKATARQRADDFERKAGTQANASIASSADQANREMLRLGGDPNKMAAMALDTANNQQLARIGAGNQIAGTNIANLNAADDQARQLQTTGFNQGVGLQQADQNQAFAIKSSALDAARASRTGAQQAAIGMNFGAAQQADTITGNARDVADTRLNNLAQGSMNAANGFANTSSQTAQNAISGGTAGVNNLNTGANAGLGAAGLVGQGTQAVLGASQLGVSGAASGYNTAARGQSTVGAGLGALASGLGNIPGLGDSIKSAINSSRWTGANGGNGLGTTGPVGGSSTDPWYG